MNKKGRNSKFEKTITINTSSVCIGDPNQNRTGVLAVRGRCPRPLDDGTITIRHHLNNLKKINLQEVFCNFIKNHQLLLHMV